MTNGTSHREEQAQPQRLGRYLLLKLLAAGGMAEIHLARHIGIEGFKKLVIIKRIHRHLALDQKFVDMFFDEARIAALLNHPNVVQIFDLGRVEGHPFIAMEYVEGVSLRDVQLRAIETSQAMPWQLVAWVGARASEGLAHAHDLRDESGEPAQLVHRDISPHNLLASFAGSVKLVDFGIARASIRIEQTQSYSRKGKLRYMSPEQTLGMPLDHRSDLFSLGIVLWELLTNTRLFDAEGELGVMQQLTEADVPDPVSPTGPLPPSLTAALRKSLEREPEDRFESASAMAEAFDKALAGVERPPNAKQLSDYLNSLFEKEAAEKRAETSALLALDIGQYVDVGAALAEDSGEHTAPREGSGAAGAGTRSQGWLYAVASAAVAVAITLGVVLSRSPVGNPVEPKPAVNVDSPPTSPAKKRAASRQPTKPPPRATRVVIRSVPPGATVELDGQTLPEATPLEPMAVSPGRHTIRYTLIGYKPHKRSITARAGRDTTADAVLVVLPPPTGRLTLNTRPWSVVYFGNRNLGQTPIVGVKLPAGRQTLRVLPMGKSPAKMIEVEIKGDRLTSITEKL